MQYFRSGKSPKIDSVQKAEQFFFRKSGIVFQTANLFSEAAF